MKFRHLGITTGLLILGCGDNPRVGLPEVWIPDVTVSDDGCAIDGALDAAWWITRKESYSGDRNYTFVPMEGFISGPVWECPEHNGGLDCWSIPVAGLGGYPYVATLTAEVDGEGLSGDIEVVSTPLTGADCTSRLTVEASKLKWSKETEPPQEASCGELEGRASVPGELRTLFILNNSNSTLHLQYIDGLGTGVALADITPYGMLSANDTQVGELFRAVRDDGTCVSMVEVGDESTMPRWLIGGL